MNESPQNWEQPASFDDGFLSQLTLIEQQPLPQRASSYQQMYLRLHTELESADAN